MKAYEFPWPSAKLSPNSRTHWRLKASLAAGQKRDWYFLARGQYMPKGTHLRFVFCPPTGHRRDLDNLLASCKHGIDGIARHMGIDDKDFSFAVERGEVVKGGMVRIEILT
ncbi:MAG: endodeoxyribonuclease RusA [Spirochaetes bacterium]|nr:MAG: endodeoxyribonuclease RusA [Spirochaetota bacterium]